MAAVLFALPSEESMLGKNKKLLSFFLTGWGELVGIEFKESVTVTGMDVVQVSLLSKKRKVEDEITKPASVETAKTGKNSKKPKKAVQQKKKQVKPVKAKEASDESAPSEGKAKVKSKIISNKNVQSPMLALLEENIESTEVRTDVVPTVITPSPTKVKVAQKSEIVAKKSKKGKAVVKAVVKAAVVKATVVEAAAVVIEVKIVKKSTPTPVEAKNVAPASVEKVLSPKRAQKENEHISPKKAKTASTSNSNEKSVSEDTNSLLKNKISSLAEKRSKKKTKSKKAKVRPVGLLMNLV